MVGISALLRPSHHCRSLLLSQRHSSTLIRGLSYFRSQVWPASSVFKPSAAHDEKITGALIPWPAAELLTMILEQMALNFGIFRKMTHAARRITRPAWQSGSMVRRSPLPAASVRPFSTRSILA